MKWTRLLVRIHSSTYFKKKTFKNWIISYQVCRIFQNKHQSGSIEVGNFGIIILPIWSKFKLILVGQDDLPDCVSTETTFCTSIWFLEVSLLIIDLEECLRHILFADCFFFTVHLWSAQHCGIIPRELKDQAKQAFQSKRVNN